ncbi:hypothetical protein JBKA6_0413 [Ichthyobacterium seriolicida]|uniref:SusD/RagB family nutrient-binding outer membrane lipoprotein n=2 Tax=Ichthyobacterium seriolicida TaxID=242600 RepID=A0A1J1DX43_9FLAO|nr:hypothetical protein JBKA6_0413 [Ichthyobacterium seriolicida]
MRGLSNLNEAKKLLKEDKGIKESVKKVRDAILDIHIVFAYSRLVETFGNIPYKEALDIENLSPKYDDAKTVYKDLISKLDKAIKAISANPQACGFPDDNVYTTTLGWKKFAAFLMFRMGLVMADVDETYAKDIVVKANNYGLFESSADNAYYNYKPVQPNQNRMYLALVASGRNDYVIAKTFIDVLESLNDPRISKLCTPVSPNKYLGGEIGKGSAYSEYSHVTDRFTKADAKGRIFDYSEVKLLLAEAVQRGFLAGDAKQHYDDGVTASIVFFGGTDAEATTYLAQPEVVYDATKWKERIGTQMWIAMYNRGSSAWLHWRRLDYPELAPAAEPFGGISQPPYRYTYPVSEQNLNKKSYEQASSAIGGDNLDTKLFWDKY